MTKIYSTNPYLQGLAEKVVKQKTDTDMAEWICNNTTLKGRPFSFKNHQFQKQILNDMHPYLTCKKLSQVGLTEGQIRKALGFMCMEPGVRIIYTFPTKILKDNNSRTRIKSVVYTVFLFYLRYLTEPAYYSYTICYSLKVPLFADTLIFFYRYLIYASDIHLKIDLSG